MEENSIDIKVSSATHLQITEHLKECNDHFVPSLSSRVDISEYSAKLHQKGKTFEAWSNSLLVGLLAVYENEEKGEIFISSLSVLTNFRKRGIGEALFDSCRDNASENIKIMVLEVGSDNTVAVRFHKRYGFKPFRTENGSIFMKYNIR